MLILVRVNLRDNNISYLRDAIIVIIRTSHLCCNFNTQDTYNR